MDTVQVRILRHQDHTYVVVDDFVEAIVLDLLKTPSDMVASRDEIIFALNRYRDSVLKGEVID